MINLKPKKSPNKKIEKVLIVTEDTKSSLNYLKDKIRNLGLSFKCSVSGIDGKETEEVVITAGKGATPDQVVQTAVQIKEEQDKIAKRLKSYSYTRIFCVMDVDDHITLGNALERLRQLNHQDELFIPIVSNECFELWYVLHYRYTTGALFRDTTPQAKQNPDKNLSKIIEKEAGIDDYDKGNTPMYSKLKSLESTAIENAEKLETFHKNNQTIGQYGVYNNPSTNVHHLICFLNSLAGGNEVPVLSPVSGEIVNRFLDKYSEKQIKELWEAVFSEFKTKTNFDRETILVDLLQNKWKSQHARGANICQILETL